VVAVQAGLHTPRTIATARLSLLPPGPEHLEDLVRLKADERVFGPMLHGVRTPARTREELEDDMDFWTVRATAPGACSSARRAASWASPG
jgi:hypothetical protein